MQSLVNFVSRRALWLFAVIALFSSAAHAQSPWRTPHENGAGADLWGVTTGPFGIVAVGTGGAILRSPEGLAWSRSFVPTTE